LNGNDLIGRKVWLRGIGFRKEQGKQTKIVGYNEEYESVDLPFRTEASWYVSLNPTNEYYAELITIRELEWE
jgi:hypothetical protein